MLSLVRLCRACSVGILCGVSVAAGAQAGPGWSPLPEASQHPEWPSVTCLASPWPASSFEPRPGYDYGPRVSEAFLFGRRLLLIRDDYDEAGNERKPALVSLDDRTELKLESPEYSTPWHRSPLPLSGPPYEVAPAVEMPWSAQGAEWGQTSRAVPPVAWTELQTLVTGPDAGPPTSVMRARVEGESAAIGSRVSALHPALSGEQWSLETAGGEDAGGVGDIRFTVPVDEVFLTRWPDPPVLLRLPRVVQLPLDVSPGWRRPDGKSLFVIDEWYTDAAAAYPGVDAVGRYAGLGLTQVTIDEDQWTADLRPVFRPTDSTPSELLIAGTYVGESGKFLLCTAPEMRDDTGVLNWLMFYLVGHDTRLPVSSTESDPVTPVLKLPLDPPVPMSFLKGPGATTSRFSPPPIPLHIATTPKGEIVLVDCRGDIYVTRALRPVEQAWKG